MSETDLSVELQARRAEKREEYTKKKNILRGTLRGLSMGNKDWFLALKALDVGEKHHKGYRKDKCTPSFQHQVEMALFGLTLIPHLLFPVRTIVCLLLHDTPEDTRVSHEEIEALFGRDTMLDVELMTKEYRGAKKDMVFYFGEMALHPVASICKLIDRANNQSTMAGVFKLEKQIEYSIETKTHILPMGKAARKLFPEQDMAYENLKFILTTQLRIFDGANAQGIAA